MNVVSLHWRIKEVECLTQTMGSDPIYGGNYPPLWHYQYPQYPHYFDIINTHNTLKILILTIPTLFWHYEHPQYFDTINTHNTHNTLTVKITQTQSWKNWDWDTPTILIQWHNALTLSNTIPTHLCRESEKSNRRPTILWNHQNTVPAIDFDAWVWC